MTARRAKRSPAIALVYAFAASFLVYCTPLIFPHVVMLWGFAIFAEFAQGFAGREPLWIAADLALAVVSQLILGAFFYWMFRGRARIRALGLVVVFPSVAAAVLTLYTAVFPVYFLIESDRHAETGKWPVACEIDNASVAAFKSGVTLALERAGEAWIYRDAATRLGLLHMPDCRIMDIAASGASPGALQDALPGGIGLYLTMGNPSGANRLIWGTPTGGTPIDIDLTTDEKVSAILSTDGGTLFWIKRLRGERRETLGYEIHGRNLTTGDETTFRIPASKPASLKLLYADPASDSYLVERNGESVIGIDHTGATVWGPIASPGFAIGRDNWRRIGGGFVAWEGYRDRGRYRIAWSLAAGKGVREIPKGRNINDVSVSPSGKLIAVSVGSALSIGHIQDSVFVLRAADGVEVFRRFFKPYTRSPVAFLSDAYFAYTRYTDDGNRRRGRIVVLRVPDEP